ncbi:MAG: type II secretion system F family protein [Actinobacteria bacterium]|nr:type II secretion system F family protein [Actinomycetota bacterium]
MLAPIVVFLVFSMVVALAYLVLSTVFSEEMQVTRRLRKMSEYEAKQAKQVEPLLRPFAERVSAPVADAVKRAGSAAAPKGYADSVRRRLVLAGNPRGMEVGRFMVVKILSAVGTGLLFTAISVIRPLSPTTWLLVVIPLVILAFFMPDLWLASRITDYKNAIRRMLPDMLDMLTISVEAGLGFDQAIAKIVRNTSGPLSEQFGRMLQEVQAGVSRAEALRHLSARTEVPELNGFIMAIVQADVFGVSVSSVLRTQAAEMRTKRRQFAEEAAQKAPVKLVFPLVLCILPATLLVILGPAAISFVRVFG